MSCSRLRSRDFNLHWLPISQHITFKIALRMFNCSCGRCAKYFGDVYAPVHTVAARSRLHFINTRLDDYNSLYFGIADGLMSRLQSVQNAAARLVTRVRRCEHITPVLRQLHWLPVCRRVKFKISTLVYRLLAGTAPVYLS